jgi:membrane-associated phospholipid phosphatase
LSGVRYSESLAIIYFAYLGVAACVRRLPLARRVSLMVIAVACCAAIAGLAHGASRGVRDWAPAGYLLVGYFASGLLAVAPSQGFEAWLVGWDRRWLGEPPVGGMPRFSGWPRWFFAYLQIVYMGCFLLIPAGLAALRWRGQGALADRYWVMVLAAEFGAFAPLAFVEARPPWALEPRAVPPAGVAHGSADRTVHSAVPSIVQRAASHWVQYLTIGVNTFPSGHVAGSLAVAFAVIGVWPLAGMVLLALALSIAVACVAGRYHYVVDVLAGAALAAGVWAVVSALYI